MTLEQLQVLITAETSGLKKELSNMKSQMNNAGQEVKKVTDGIKKSFSALGVAAAGAFGVKKIADYTKASINAASQLEGAMLGLRSILEGQGKSFTKANSFIQSYISDGLVPLTDAVTAYKSLAARGYNDEQIQQVMSRLKDAAAFGRQSSYTLGEAVKSAAEGLKNENSVLVDNAGVTKNVAKMWDEYAASIGKNRNNLTQQEKIQAEVNGIMQETQFQAGDAAKYTQTYAGKVAALSKTMQDIKVNIGQAFMPIANVALPLLQSLADTASRVTGVISQFMQALFGANKTQAQTAIMAAKAQTGVGDAVEEAGKKAKKSIAGFDEINQLQDDMGDTDSGSDAAEVPVMDIPAAEVEADGETLSGMKEMDDNLKTLLEPVITAFEDIKKAAEPIITTIGDGLKWFYDNVLKPFGEWTIAEAIPSFFNLLSGAFAIINPLLESFKPLGEWLWINFLQPIAAWTGEAFITTINGVADTLKNIGDWMSNNKSIVEGVTTAVMAFFAAWKLTELLAFIQMSGGLIGIINNMTNAIKAGIVAKLASKAETIYLTALYAKEAIANGVSTIATIAATAATWGMTAATTALNIAMGILLSPITLIIAAIAALTVAGILLYKHFSEESIPEIQRFGPEVSESTQQAVGAFMDLEENATKSLKLLTWSGQAVTAEMKDSIVGNFNAMSEQIASKVSEAKEKALASMNEMVSNSTILSEEEKNAMIQATQKSWEEKERIANEGKLRVNEILTKASEENRSLTQAEADEINKIKSDMLNLAVETLSENELEQAAILERMRANASDLSARQAAEVVQNSLKQKDESIKAAEDEYNERLKIAARLRAEGTEEAKQLADKIIEEATRQRDEAILKAEDMHSRVIDEAKKQAGEHIDNVNWETGEVLSKWEVFKNNMSKKWNDIKNSIKTAVDNTINGIKQAFDSLKTKLDNIWDNIKQAASNAWNGLWDIIRGVINSITGGINKFINAWNSIRLTIPEVDIPLVGKVGGFSIGLPTIPTIPKLANGGIVNANDPMLAIIGDNRTQKEVVAPLGDLTNMIASAVGSAVMAAMQFNNNPSGDNRDIVMNIDGAPFARIIKPFIDKESQRVGNVIILNSI